MRITDRHDEGLDRIARLLLVGHELNERATIRWILLRDEGGGP